MCQYFLSLQQMMKQVHFGRKATISFFILFGLFVWITIRQDSKVELRYVMVSEPTQDSEMIYLLYWNKYLGGDQTWGMREETSTPEDLERINCPKTNCIFTRRRDTLPYIHDFDVLFINSWFEIKLPNSRSPHQYYILSTAE